MNSTRGQKTDTSTACIITLAARLADAEHNYADIITAQTNLMDELASMKNDIDSLKQSVKIILDKLEAG